MKPSKSNILKWTQALRSGKYYQTRLKLQTPAGYCCLGVACDVFIPKSKQNINSDGLLHGSIPASQYHSPTWLLDINVEFEFSTGLQLSQLNDVGVFSFDEIADLLELVYIHKALD